MPVTPYDDLRQAARLKVLRPILRAFLPALTAETSTFDLAKLVATQLDGEVKMAGLARDITHLADEFPDLCRRGEPEKNRYGYLMRRYIWGHNV